LALLRPYLPIRNATVAQTIIAIVDIIIQVTIEDFQVLPR
jgi:hypothetical protein